MNNDDAQSIILVITLLFALGLMLFPFLVFFIYVFFQNSKRKRIRARMLTAHQQLVGNRRWLPVRYASQPRFKAWFKIFPWGGSGVIVLAPGSVLFLGETNSGLPVNVQFAPRNAQINWIGKSPFPNGAVSWFSFTLPDRTEYFSSETGPFVFGSHRSTRELFDEANKSFSGQS
jgi:hypothetical protein